MGLMKRSYFGGLRVKPSPTKHTFVTILFQAFFCLFPVLMTLSTSVSPWARTFGRGTSHLPCTKHPMFAFRNLCCFLTRVATSWNKQQMANTYSFLLPFLFYHVGKDFSVGLSLSVQQVSWNCTLRSFVIILLLGFSLFVHFDAIKKSRFVHIERYLQQQRSQHFPCFKLTSSSSGSSQQISVCGKVWPSNQSSSWLCGSAHEPLDSPFSFSSHGGPGGTHAACDATQCARSEATKQETAAVWVKLTAKFNKHRLK